MNSLTHQSHQPSFHLLCIVPIIMPRTPGAESCDNLWTTFLYPSPHLLVTSCLESCTKIRFEDNIKKSKHKPYNL